MKNKRYYQFNGRISTYPMDLKTTSIFIIQRFNVCNFILEFSEMCIQYIIIFEPEASESSTSGEHANSRDLFR